MGLASGCWGTAAGGAAAPFCTGTAVGGRPLPTTGELLKMGELATDGLTTVGLKLLPLPQELHESQQGLASQHDGWQQFRLKRPLNHGWLQQRLDVQPTSRLRLRPTSNRRIRYMGSFLEQDASASLGRTLAT
jgi:hypothetical protein